MRLIPMRLAFFPPAGEWPGVRALLARLRAAVIMVG